MRVALVVGCLLVAACSANNDTETETRALQPNCACGWTAAGQATRIVGGEVSEVAEFPLAALLIVKANMFPFCGGSIITQRHIVTAAHCTEDKFNTPLAVLLGEHDYSTVSDTSATRMYDISRIIQHSAYDNRNIVNDIALLVTTVTIQYTNQIGPVCLPPANLNLDYNVVTSIGWGRTAQGGNASPVLRKVNLNVIPFSNCRTYWGLKSDNSQLCTLTQGKGFCQGDSGGPVVWVDPQTYRYTLVGLPSYVSQCADSYPGVSTRVSSFVSWIRTNVQASVPTAQVCSAY